MLQKENFLFNAKNMSTCFVAKFKWNVLIRTSSRVINKVTANLNAQNDGSCVETLFY